ncbi:MAG: ferric reductase-like transmembrane domain-containing protein [Polyangiaceae bacterium]
MSEDDTSTAPWSRFVASERRRGVGQATPEVIQRLLGIKSPHLAERILMALSPTRPPASLAEAHAMAETLATSSLEDKLGFLFRLHDVNGDGRLDRREIEWMIHVALGESGLLLPPGKAEELVRLMMAEADVDRDHTLNFAEFRRVVALRPLVMRRLAERGTSMLKVRRAEAHAPQPRAAADRFDVLRRNAVLAGWVAAFCLVNVALFTRAFVAYGAAGANVWIQIARGCGACLNLCGPWLLIPMLRHVWTAIRRTPLAPIFPLDHNIEIHRAIGEGVFILSILHSVAHGVNLLVAVTPHPWAPAYLTGYALLAVLLVMWACARPRVREKGRFELFHFTHLAYWAWFALAVLHGPVFWMWLVLPGAAFLFEQLLRLKVRIRPTALLDARPLASGVTMLRFARAESFDYEPGDFVFICVPSVARGEWHPFTLTSAPEHKSSLTVHVRSLGNWTRALRERYSVPIGHYGQAIYVDGPYGTPSAHIFEHEHAVLVGAGIGVTPFASVLKSLHMKRQLGEPGRLRRLHFVWISREQESFEWFTQLLSELESKNDSGWLDLCVYFTGAKKELEGSVLDLAKEIHFGATGADLITGLRTRTRLGRPDLDALLAAFVAEASPGGLPRPSVFYCGPAALGRELERAAARLELPYRFERF